MSLKEMVPKSQMELARQALGQLGIYEYGPQEVRRRYDSLYDVINSAVNLEPDATKPHKLSAMVNTGINLISPEGWEKVGPGKALVCAFAGTNWVISVMEKDDKGSVTMQELYSREMSEFIGKNYTSEDFAKLMTQEITNAVKATNLNVSEIKAIGIALGFAQENLRVDGGVDARFTPESGSKGWHFVGNLDVSPKDRPSLGNLLISNLKETSDEWNVKHFAFRNDTHGVAEDGQTMDGYVLPIGFVFGTGVNGAAGPINFELGKFPVEVDPVIRRMKEMNLLPDFDVYQEYLMGGNFIKYRIAAAIDLLGTTGVISQGKEIAKALLENKDGKLISIIASTDDLDEIKSVLGFDFKFADSAPILQLVCKTALAQAGQIMGINMAAVATAAGYKTPNEAVIPIEGSVYWKGYGVKESVRKTVDQILPGNKLIPQEASGLRGIGKVALTQTIY